MGEGRRRFAINEPRSLGRQEVGVSIRTIVAHASIMRGSTMILIYGGACHRALFLRSGYLSILQKHFLDIPAFPPHPLRAHGLGLSKPDRRTAMRALATAQPLALIVVEKAGEERKLRAKVLINLDPRTFLTLPAVLISRTYPGFGRVFLANSKHFLGKIWDFRACCSMNRHVVRQPRLTGRRA